MDPQRTIKEIKDTKIYVEDFMVGDEEEESEEDQQQFETRVSEIRNGRLNEVSTQQFQEILTSLIIKKDKFIIKRYGSINEDYEFEKELGKGAYGSVYKATHRLMKKSRAIKRIPKSKIKNFDRFINEVNSLKTLDHPNVVKLFELYESSHDVYLVQELCTGGELLDQIVDQKHMSETKAALIFKQIIQAILYCNKNNISHRDLKPENFMFSSDKPGAVLKLIDFGLAKTYYKAESPEVSQVVRMKTRAGTAYFMAPEVILNDYSNACDMWSAGVILYIMLCGYPPFSGASDEQILENILRGEYDFDDPLWDTISDEAKDLIEHLIIEEEERLTPQQTLEHPWIKTFSRLDSEVTLSSQHTERLRNFQKAK